MACFAHARVSLGYTSALFEAGVSCGTYGLADSCQVSINSESLFPCEKIQGAFFFLAACSITGMKRGDVGGGNVSFLSEEVLLTVPHRACVVCCLPGRYILVASALGLGPFCGDLAG